MTSTSSDPPTSFPPRTPTTARTSKKRLQKPTIPAKPLSPEHRCHAFAAAERHRPHLSGKQPLDHPPQIALSNGGRPFLSDKSMLSTDGSAFVAIMPALPFGPTNTEVAYPGMPPLCPQATPQLSF